MSSNFKYALEKNKSKILVGTSIVLFAGIGVGSYFLFTGDDNGRIGEVQELESKLAATIVSGSENGILNMIDTETGESVDSITLPSGTYIYTGNNGYDTLYAYNGEIIYAYALENEEFVEKGQLASFEVEGATHFKVDGVNVAFLSNNGQTLTYLYQHGDETKTKVIELQDNVDDFKVSNGILTYSTNTNLHAFSSTSEESIDLGDGTNVITTFQDRVLIHNNFGSGLENSILVSLNQEDLKILELQETLSADTNLLSLDNDDQSFYTTEYVSSTEPYHLLDEWKIQDGKIVKEQDVTVKIPVKKDGVVYDHETTVASDGYLYTHYKDRVQIFDIRSHDVWKELSVDEYFAMPVLVD